MAGVVDQPVEIEFGNPAARHRVGQSPGDVGLLHESEAQFSACEPLGKWRHQDPILVRLPRRLSRRHRDEVRWLLSRPFFLHLVTSGRVRVPEDASPGDIYKSFLDNLQRGFTERFSFRLPLTDALSRVAYRALDNEREAFPLTWLTDQLLMIGDSSFGSTQDMVNWLIASSALIPYSGGRISFVHQSITEYCAALELVRLSEAGDFSLRVVRHGFETPGCACSGGQG